MRSERIFHVDFEPVASFEGVISLIRPALPLKDLAKRTAIFLGELNSVLLNIIFVWALIFPP